jgi:Polysaccharide deacetylase
MTNRAQKPTHLNRREALHAVGATVALATVASRLTGVARAATTTIDASDRSAGGFWRNGAWLAVPLPLMFEGGGQPISGAGGVIPEPIEKGVPDLPTNAFFAYGHYEGIPRVLDLMDKHGIKLSSFMIGKAVETSPDLAQEIVRRGHEAAAHGRVWDNSYQLSRDEEKRFIADSVETIERRLERGLDAQLHPFPKDAAGIRLSLSQRRAEPGRTFHRAGARSGLRYRPLHLSHERHRLLSSAGTRPLTSRPCATSSISFTKRVRIGGVWW